MKRMALLLLMSAMAQPLWAGIYKWVDENGQVHYGERPPASKQASEVTLEKPPVSAEVAAERRESAKQDIAASEEERAKRKEEKAKREQEQAQAKQEAEQRKQNCSAARASLHLYQTSGRIFRMNEKGERNYLDDTGRAAAQKRAQADVAKWCR